MNSSKNLFIYFCITKITQTPIIQQALKRLKNQRRLGTLVIFLFLTLIFTYSTVRETVASKTSLQDIWSKPFRFHTSAVNFIKKLSLSLTKHEIS
jgi:hypothetical protein